MRRGGCISRISGIKFFQLHEGKKTFHDFFLGKELFRFAELGYIAFSGCFRQVVEFLNPGRGRGGRQGLSRGDGKKGERKGCQQKGACFHKQIRSSGG